MQKINGDQRKILIVDDSDAIRFVTHEMLSSLNFKISEATSGVLAIEKARLELFDLILMDISMPDMDGLETVKRIRTLSELHEEIPIVALTGHNKQVMEQKLVEYGLDGYIAKPIDKMSLLTEINRHLEPGNSEEIYSGKQHSIDDHRLSELIEDVGMEAVERLFKAFLIEGEQKLNNIESYLISEDFALLECESHALKSASLNFGLDQLSDTMAEMEEAAIHKNLEMFKELARTASRQFELLPNDVKLL